MRKTIFVLILSVFLFSTLLSSCTKEDLNKELIGAVKKVEILDNKYSNFYINWDEYIKELNNMFVENYFIGEHLARAYMPPYIVLSQDLINIIKEKGYELSDDERSKIVNLSKKFTIDISTQISDVYSIGDYKYVFTKTKIMANYKSSYRYLYSVKKYTFTKDGYGWKIAKVDTKYFNSEIDMTRYNSTIDGQKIVYPLEINPLKND